MYLTGNRFRRSSRPAAPAGEIQKCVQVGHRNNPVTARKFKQRKVFSMATARVQMLIPTEIYNEVYKVLSQFGVKVSALVTKLDKYYTESSSEQRLAMIKRTVEVPLDRQIHISMQSSDAAENLIRNAGGSRNQGHFVTRLFLYFLSLPDAEKLNILNL